MITSKKRIRVDYAPLDIVVSVQTSVGDNCAKTLSQTLDTLTQVYEPDHAIYPIRVRVSVSASASDGTWSAGECNHLLKGNWYTMDGDLLDEQFANGLYTEFTSGENSGMFELRKNFMPGEYMAVRYIGALLDARTGRYIDFVSDPITLSGVARATDEYKLSFDTDTSVIYDPVKDSLAAYEYAVAHNDKTIPYPASDENTYRKRFNITLRTGKTVVPSDRYRIETSPASGKAVDMSEVSITKTANGYTLDIDLRLVNKTSYAVKAYVSSSERVVSTEVASAVISVVREKHCWEVEQLNTTSINHGDKRRADKIFATCDRLPVIQPSRLLDIAWYAETQNGQVVNRTALNTGVDTVFNLADVGFNSDSEWLDVFVEATPREAMSLAVDNLGNLLTDNNGNELIFQ